jgi:hypothetical protein
MIPENRWQPLALVLLVSLPAAASEEPPGISEKDRQHWAFRPLVRPQPPDVHKAERRRTPVDAFLLARLAARGLTFAPDADRVTLLRRAYLDLWGLPPAPEEVDAFLADDRPDAYERLLDRLLASPHFGERWARHWLDVVGYADTVGFDIDAPLIITTEGKWRYRDYVIAAFNQDKPYDRFVTEQLAGDELVDWRKASRFSSEMRESLIATGFLRTARDLTHEPESNIPLCYYGVLHDTVAMVGNSLLGLTLNCAQCHNHKFDPIPQKDYYQLMALFTPAYNPQNWKPVYPWKPDVKDRGLPDVSPAEVAEIERHNADIARQEAELNGQLAALRRPVETRLREARLLTVPEPIRADTRTALETPAAKRTDIQKYLAGKFEPLLQVKLEEVTAALAPADRARAGKLSDQLAALKAQRRSFSKIQALYDVGPPPRTFLFKRGNFESPGPEVQPGFLSVLSDPSRAPNISTPPASQSSGRRLALARWLTEKDSPATALLARVMVNRLWQHLFGQGLVPSPDNFGRSGQAPTHPELLEWLSAEFIHNGYCIKPTLKLLMTSTAYRQASRLELPGTPDPRKIDPTNQLLWRQRLRRLEAEVVRDSLLSVSGQLDPTMGGPPVLLRVQPDGKVVIDEKALLTRSARNKRSIYLLFRRAYNLSLLSVFDQPVIAVNCPCRDAATVPLQSLTMLNDAFVLEQAKAFADRVARQGGTAGEKTIRIAYRLALARPPSAAEITICTQLLERQAVLFRASKRSDQEAHHLALVQLCHTLLNTSEFLYVE